MLCEVLIKCLRKNPFTTGRETGHTPPVNKPMLYSSCWKYCPGPSLVVQWLRIRLPMQGTRVRALVWEDPTCRGETKPVHHNYWACALEPACHKYWSPHAYSPCSVAREATTTRSPRTATKSSSRSPQLEKARAQQRRPNAAIKLI